MNIFIRCLIIFQGKVCTDLLIKHAPAPQARGQLSPPGPLQVHSLSQCSPHCLQSLLSLVVGIIIKTFHHGLDSASYGS